METGDIMKISELKRNTNVYRDVMKIQKGPWFWSKFCRKKSKFTKHCQLFLRLLTGDQLHDRDNSQHRCRLYDVRDKVSYYLFTCISLQHIANVMPPAMVIEMDEMDDAERTTFLANVLNGTLKNYRAFS